MVPCRGLLVLLVTSGSPSGCLARSFGSLQLDSFFQAVSSALAKQVAARQVEEASFQRASLSLHHLLGQLRAQNLAIAPAQYLEEQIALWADGPELLRRAVAARRAREVEELLAQTRLAIRSIQETFQGDIVDGLEAVCVSSSYYWAQNDVNFEATAARGAVLAGLLARKPDFHSRVEEVIGPLEWEWTHLPHDEAVAGRASPMPPVEKLHMRCSSAVEIVEKQVLEGAAEAKVAAGWCRGLVGMSAAAYERLMERCRSVLQQAASFEGSAKGWLASRASSLVAEVRSGLLQLSANTTALEALQEALEAVFRAMSGSEPEEILPPTGGGTLSATSAAKELEIAVSHTQAESKQFESELQLLLDEAEKAKAEKAKAHDVRELEPEPEEPPLLGLMRRVVAMYWMAEVSSLVVSKWFERLRLRSNEIMHRLRHLHHRQQTLHERLRRHPDFRRLAFEEIHAAGHWGLRNSGGGSHHTVTQRLARGLVDLLARSPPFVAGGARVLLDVGCGWGEWLPPFLHQAAMEGRIRGDFQYIGVEIAAQPVEHLLELTREWRPGHWAFQQADAVTDDLPEGADVAVVRDVVQHLGMLDVLRLLLNVRRAAPRHMLLSSCVGSTNLDVDGFGGPSSFSYVNAQLRRPGGYDLRRPPFSFPEPLLALPEEGRNVTMLFYSTSALADVDLDGAIAALAQ